MTLRFARHLVFALVALTAIGGGTAWAEKTPHRDTRDARDSDNDLPNSVRRIQRETGGEVLKAQPMQRDGREVYRVKVLTPQGRIRVVEDAPPPRNDPPRRDDPPPAYHPPRDHYPD